MVFDDSATSNSIWWKVISEIEIEFNLVHAGALAGGKIQKQENPKSSTMWTPHCFTDRCRSRIVQPAA
jgi:hypothetical protein